MKISTCKKAIAFDDETIVYSKTTGTPPDTYHAAFHSLPFTVGATSGHVEPSEEGLSNTASECLAAKLKERDSTIDVGELVELMDQLVPWGFKPRPKE